MQGSSILRTVGYFYAVILIIVLTYLWYSGRWKAKAGWILLIITSALGFLIFSPMAPHQFQEIMLRDIQELGTALTIAAVSLAIILVITFVTGRFFCGYLCPVGALQEIASRIPVHKTVLHQKKLLNTLRGMVFLLFIGLAFLFSVSLLAPFGISDFFGLTITSGSIVFALILLLSLTVYRPFCRVICPLGTLLSVGAGASLLALERTGACNDCGKCEKVCPVDEAKRDDSKAECYLCGRCMGVCPENTAIVYGQRGAVK